MHHKPIFATLALVASFLFTVSCGNHSFEEWLGLDSSSSEGELNGSSSSRLGGSSSSSSPVANVSSDSHSGAVVGPLLQIKWNQYSPYNDLFPIDAECGFSDDNGRLPTNCVNTAYVQIMGFHKYPARGKGESSKVISSCGGVDVPLTSLNVAYDWGNMLNEYTSRNPGNEQQRKAVATLMYHFGLARGFGITHYSSEYGDLRENNVLRKIMVNIFGYDKSLQCFIRPRYSDAEWEAMIRRQLDLGLPVFFEASDEFDKVLPHAFVIDGYDNAGKFHINPGWGGSYNGWYPLRDINFGDKGHYNSTHKICINIKPDVSSTLSGTFTDSRDGKKYKTVKIGTQTWMAENLNIETGKSECYFDWDEDKTFCNEYGRLYDWETAMKACPSGWHLPNNAEWDKLLRYTDGKIGTESPYRSISAGKFLKAENGWKGYGIATGCNGFDCGGTDNFGFSALPGGAGSSAGYLSFGGIGNNVGNDGYWWSSSEDNNGNAYTLYMSSGSEYASWPDTKRDKSDLRSVRCIQGNAKDAEAEAKAKEEEEKAKAKAEEEKAKAEREAYIKANGGTFTDTRDSKAYDFVKIGNQTWMAENLNYEEDGSKCYKNEPANCAIYGRLYNWSTAMALPSSCDTSFCVSQVNEKHKGVCPSGWHLPSKVEWETLITAVGGESTSGRYLKAQNGWTSCGKGSSYLYQCEDTYAFSALPGAYGYSSGSFDNSIGTRAYYWSSTENKDNGKLVEAKYMTNGSNVGYDNKSWKNYFYSVRCVKD